MNQEYQICWEKIKEGSAFIFKGDEPNIISTFKPEPELNELGNLYIKEHNLYIEANVLAFLGDKLAILKVNKIVENLKNDCEMYGYNPWMHQHRLGNICGKITSRNSPCYLEHLKIPADKRICVRQNPTKVYQ